jgi:hypothetical protein
MTTAPCCGGCRWSRWAIARQLGHGAELTLRTYGYVIEELEDSPQLPAEEAIRQARERIASGEMDPFCTRERRNGERSEAGLRVLRLRPDLDSNQGPTP